MKNRSKFHCIALILFISSITPAAYAQVIEVDAAFGGAPVTDIEDWTNIYEDGATFRLSDWSFFSGYTSINGFYPVSKSISLGGSIGYQHLFWYEYKYYDIDGIYRSTYHEDVNATRLMLLARINFANNFVDLGVGGFIVKDVIDNYSAPAVLATVGHFFKVTDNISIPLKISGGVIIEGNPIIPITIGTGISYRMK